MTLILFIDDEIRYIETYIEELRDNDFLVEYQQDVDKALQFLAENINAVDLIILDLMMPPGKSFELVDTELGRRTGVKFYERVRQMTPYIPVIILTNVTEEQMARKFGAEEQCSFCMKRDYKPPALVAEVRRALESFPTIG